MGNKGVITALRLTGVWSSRLVVASEREKFFSRTCWKRVLSFSTLARVTSKHTHTDEKEDF